MYHGDYSLGETINIKFTTVNSSGVPTALSSGVVSAYPGNSLTEITAGITLTPDFDTRTGLNNVAIVASSGNGYATATDYALVVTAGTVGGSSIVGYTIGSFSIEKRVLNTAKIADGAITAAKLATDAITAAKIAADAIAEIQAGLSTFDYTTDLVNLDPADTPPDVPTLGTVGDAIKRMVTTLPLYSEPGQLPGLTAGGPGLATTANVFAACHVGPINDTTPSASVVDLHAAYFVNATDHYKGQRFVVLSGTQKPRTTYVSGQAGLTVTLTPALPGSLANGDIVMIIA